MSEELNRPNLCNINSVQVSVSAKLGKNRFMIICTIKYL